MLNPSRCRIIAIGKVRKRWIQDGLNIYLKRLPGLTITELRDSTARRESKEILTSLKAQETLVVLSEEGETLTSINFANRLNTIHSQKLVFVIGGAEGLTNEIKDSANWILSLSNFTFPHEIARLLLVEQLYRSFSILQNTPYHRN